MSKLTLLAAFGAGYVLGARAGRERYEQIATQARRIAEDPRVQAASSRAQETITHQAAVAAHTVQDKVSDRFGHDDEDLATTGGSRSTSKGSTTSRSASTSSSRSSRN